MGNSGDLVSASEASGSSRGTLRLSGERGHKDIDEGNTDGSCDAPFRIFRLHRLFLPSGSALSGVNSRELCDREKIAQRQKRSH